MSLSFYIFIVFFLFGNQMDGIEDYGGESEGKDHTGK